MIEVIARAIIEKDGKILFCKSITQGNYFLPGGHIEFGENAEQALQREMIEESDTEVSHLKFIGCFENFWGDPIHHEYNLIYSADIMHTNISSKEDHIAFEWVEISKLADIPFYPKVFLDTIVRWIADRNDIYLSTAHNL